MLGGSADWEERRITSTFSYTERVFVKEEEYIAEKEEAETFGGEEDGTVEDAPMQEQGDVVGDNQGDAMMEGEGVKDDQEDSDLDDMF